MEDIQPLIYKQCWFFIILEIILEAIIYFYFTISNSHA